MAIVPRPVQGSYDNALFDFILGSEGFVPRVYSDHRGIPTLGLGYALLVDAAGWPRRDGLREDFAAIGVIFSEQDETLLDAVSRALALGRTGEAINLVAPWRPGERPAERNAFSFLIDKEQARALFQRVRPGFEAVLAKRLGSALLERFAGSQELMALFSLAYNSPALIGPGLTAAMKAGERGKVWYEIRFGSNLKRHPGLQNRRDHEAEIFGCLNEQPETDEKRAFRQLMDSRREEMSRYLAEVGLDDGQITTALAKLEDAAKQTRLA